MHDLRVDAAPSERTYIRFNVNVTSGDSQHVSLLVGSTTRSRAGYQVRLVEDAWRERAITFANAPVLSLDYVASGPLKARAWKAVDITMLTDEKSGGDDYLSLALTTASAKGLSPGQPAGRRGCTARVSSSSAAAAAKAASRRSRRVKVCAASGCVRMLHSARSLMLTIPTARSFSTTGRWRNLRRA